MPVTNEGGSVARGLELLVDGDDVMPGRVSIALKLTAAGKRLLAKRKPTSLTLRTKGTLERVTTIKLRTSPPGR